jgi:hypothetical protein
MPAYPQFIGGSHVSQSPVADHQRTVNWYVEKLEQPGGTTQLALYPTPGVRTLATAATTPGRAHFARAAREFAVIGTTYVEIDAGGTITERGTVAVDEYPATISSNGDGGGQNFVTSGNNGYLHDLGTNAFTQVRTGATRLGAHLNGYFLTLDADTSTLFLSDLLDGTTWDPTQFAQRSIEADPWVSLAVQDRYLWLFGETTSEVWYDAGSFPFPFAPHPSGLVPFGCRAIFSPKVAAGALHWLAQTKDGPGQIVRAAGFSPEVISTAPVQVALAGYSSLSDAVGDAYQDLAHSFYVLSFPTAQATWVFDARDQVWHERGTWLSAESRYDAWRPCFHAFVFNQHRMLDRASGAIYDLSPAYGTDAEDRPLRRLRRGPTLWDDQQRLFVSVFELHLEPGLGLTSGQGSDPQVTLRISTDGGKTWSSERGRSAGQLGHYDTRVRWWRCGSGRAWVAEIVVSDPIPWRILGALIEVSGPTAQPGGQAAA